MPLGVAFWILLLLWLLFGGYNGWKNSQGQWYWAGPWILEFLLWFVAGLKLFGSPIQG